MGRLDEQRSSDIPWLLPPKAAHLPDYLFLIRSNLVLLIMVIIHNGTSYQLAESLTKLCLLTSQLALLGETQSNFLK